MIEKAEEWLQRVKLLSTSTSNPEHVREHAELLQWLIDTAKAYEAMKKSI